MTEVLHIKGLTLRTKNRVQNHGSKWVELSSHGQIKDHVLLKSLKDGYLAWFYKEDYKVEIITKEIL